MYTAQRRLGGRRRFMRRPLVSGLWWLRLASARLPRHRHLARHVSVLFVGFLAILATPGLLPSAAAPAVAPAAVEPVAEPAHSSPEPRLAVADPPATPSPTPEPRSQPIVYRVQPGDTLRELADRFGISVETIVSTNRLSDPDLISVGQELVILPVSGVLHSVGPGETLRQVAARYGVDPEEVARANQLPDEPDAPVQAAQLVVPGARPTAVVAPAPSKRAAPHEQVAAIAELAPLPPASNPGEASPSQMAVEQAVPPTPVPQPTPVPKPTPLSPITYEVQPGDTLNTLAAKFGTDTTTLLTANDIDDPDTITIGVKLRVWPAVGVEHEVRSGETLQDIARLFEVDLGPIVDFNGLANADVIIVGQKLFIPGAKPLPPAPVARPAAPAARQEPAPAPRRPAPPAPVVGGGGAGVVANAMNFLGYPYVWGGTSPSGFDCSGFVYYVHQISGSPVSRGMWGQYNGGPRIAIDDLEPGDTVFFVNTYMPGLSHNGIYIGGGRFIHASDPSTGVVISSLWEPYWSSRYAGATRLW